MILSIFDILIGELLANFVDPSLSDSLKSEFSTVPLPIEEL